MQDRPGGYSLKFTVTSHEHCKHEIRAYGQRNKKESMAEIRDKEPFTPNKNTFEEKERKRDVLCPSGS